MPVTRYNLKTVFNKTAIHNMQQLNSRDLHKTILTVDYNFKIVKN